MTEEGDLEDRERSRVLAFPEPSSAHLSGRAICTRCGHQWVAVAPVGTVWLECPDCRTELGLYAMPMLEVEGELIWICRCGGYVFIFTPSGARCCGCGAPQCFP